MALVRNQRLRNALALLLPTGWTRQHLIRLSILFFVFLVSAQIAIELFTAPALVSPAAGIALAGLVVGGSSLWPAIFFASLLSSLINGLPMLLTLLLPVAYTIQAVVGAFILRKLDFDPRLSRTRDILALMGVAFSSSIVVPTFGQAVFYLHNTLTHDSFPIMSWSSWWVGVILSVLTVAPFAIRWSVREDILRFSWRNLEAVTVTIALMLASVGLWWLDLNSYLDLSFLYAIFIFLAWLGIRFGSRSTTAGILLFTTISISGLLFGVRASDEPLGPQVLGVEILIIPVAILFFILMSMGEERRNALQRAQDHVKELQIALRKIMEEARAKSDFISILAHELRNPLAPILSATELLKLRSNAEDSDTELHDIIESRAQMMRRLLDDLLDVSRVSDHKFELRNEHLDLREVITNSIRMIKSKLDAQGQTLNVKLPAHPLLVDGDPVRMEQVFTNLLNNATKFTPDRGRLSITAATDNGNVVVQVVDTGSGIDPEIRDRIFEPFVRSGHTERGETGLGIGLFLTRKFVELQRGSIVVESPGESQGSTFTVTFPLVLPEKTKTESASAEQGRFELEKPDQLKVLVVDDNIQAANMIGQLLQVSGHHPILAYSGKAAMEKVRSYVPDVVILDIGLPDTSGYEVARWLRQEVEFSGPLIALTGYGQEEDKRATQEVGFDHHLTKPVSLDELLKVLTFNSHVKI